MLSFSAAAEASESASASAVLFESTLLWAVKLPHISARPHSDVKLDIGSRSNGR